MKNMTDICCAAQTVQCIKIPNKLPDTADLTKQFR